MHTPLIATAIASSHPRRSSAITSIPQHGHSTRPHRHEDGNQVRPRSARQRSASAPGDDEGTMDALYSVRRKLYSVVFWQYSVCVCGLHMVGVHMRLQTDSMWAKSVLRALVRCSSRATVHLSTYIYRLKKEAGGRNTRKRESGSWMSNPGIFLKVWKFPAWFASRFAAASLNTSGLLKMYATRMADS